MWQCLSSTILCIYIDVDVLDWHIISTMNRLSTMSMHLFHNIIYFFIILHWRCYKTAGLTWWMILTMMNGVKYRADLFYSIIGIGNNHLELFALNKCNSIDFDWHILSRLCNNIQSLTLHSTRSIIVSFLLKILKQAHLLH